MTILYTIPILIPSNQVLPRHRIKSFPLIQDPNPIVTAAEAEADTSEKKCNNTIYNIT